MKDRYNVTDLPAPYDISCDMKHLLLPCRDGVKLHTTVVFPPGFSGKAPVLLVRTPYSRRSSLQLPDGFALKHGFVWVCQACRGTGWSDGVFDPAERETEKNDAEDLFRWLDGQEWFDGRVAMRGGSYPGWVQWAAARTGYAGLTGIVPRVAPLSSCIGSPCVGGGAQLSFAIHWMLSMHHRRQYGYDGVPNYDDMHLARQLPVIDADKHAFYPENAPFRKFLLAGRNPATTLESYQENFKGISCPAFVQGGWFDKFKDQTIAGFQLMQAHAATEKARAFSRLWIGPWGHGGLLNPDIFGTGNGQQKMLAAEQEFLANVLTAPDADPLPGVPAVTYFLLGENSWEQAECWPPKGTAEKTLYLRSDGFANGSHGNGRLSEMPPTADEPADMYVTDPDKPTISDEGTDKALGCYDIAAENVRADVLVYDTAEMRDDITVAGKLTLRFFAAVSALDTDFFATLSDVCPDGRSMYLTQGMVRARFRNGYHKEELLDPNAVTEFTIGLSDIAVRFKPGHKMRLMISGQWFPSFDRNANTGGPLFEDTVLKPARCGILHDAAHPATLIVPVL